MEFKNYTYIRANVTALKLGTDTYSAIVDALTADLAAGKIDSFNVSTAAGAEVPTIVFKYATDSIELTLTAGDYLVVYADGTKTRWGADAFEKEYAESTNTADAAVVGEATAG